MWYTFPYCEIGGIKMKQNETMHGLRGLASVIVVFFHIYGMAYIGGFFEKREIAGFFRIFHNFGSMGVNMFFMLSGYLIIGSLARHGNIKNFMINRIIRIYPVFLTLHIVLFLFGPIINYEWLGDVSITQYIAGFISNLLLLPGIFDLPIAQKNAWSLSYEFLFYIVSALFFLITLKIKKKSLKYISLSLLTALSVVVIYNHPTALFFILGVIVYYSQDLIKSKYQYKKYYFLNGVILLPVIFYIYDAGNSFAIVPLILSLIMFWVVVNQEGLLSKILKTKVFQFLGTISYSLYLIHPFALFPFKIIFSTEKVKMLIENEYVRISLFGSISLTVAIIGSYISYRLLEVALTSKLKSLTKKKRIIKSYKVKESPVS